MSKALFDDNVKMSRWVKISQPCVLLICNWSQMNAFDQKLVFLTYEISRLTLGFFFWLTLTLRGLTTKSVITQKRVEQYWIILWLTSNSTDVTCLLFCRIYFWDDFRSLQVEIRVNRKVIERTMFRNSPVLTVLARTGQRSAWK